MIDHPCDRTIDGTPKRCGLFHVERCNHPRALAIDGEPVRRRVSAVNKPAGSVVRGSVNHGYRVVKLTINGRSRRFSVHRLLAFAFLGPPPFDGAVVRHLNDRHLDNRLENLAWGTVRDNTADRIRNGFRFIEERNHKVKLSVEQVREIRRAILYLPYPGGPK